MKVEALRFAVGTDEKLYGPVWRLWSNRSDAYLAARTAAGLLKISLHQSGEWVSAFTKQSGQIIKETGSRRHAQWQRPEEFVKGWTKGPQIITPWVEWHDDLTMRDKKHPSTSWLPAPKKGTKTVLGILFSSPEAGLAIRKVLRPILMQGYAYEKDYLQLDNGERVWLYAYEEPITLAERKRIEQSEKQFRVFTTTGDPSKVSIWAMEIYASDPLILQFPLGLRHLSKKPDLGEQRLLGPGIRSQPEQMM